MAKTYATPIVLSKDRVFHEPGRPGEPIDPDMIPISGAANNILKKDEDGLKVVLDSDVISAEPNNPLEPGADGKLKVNTSKLVDANDKILSVSDNKIKSTLTFEKGDNGTLLVKGKNGVLLYTLDIKEIAGIGGIPTLVEYLEDVTPPMLPRGNYLHLQFEVASGKTKDIYIDYEQIFDLDAGNGIVINAGHAVSVKPKANGYIIVDKNGVDADVAAIKKKILTGEDPGGGGGGGSIVKPNGGLGVDDDGQLYVVCNDIAGCVQQKAGAMFSPSNVSGVSFSDTASPKAKVNFAGLTGAARKAVVEGLIKENGAGGLSADATTGRMAVDFSQATQNPDVMNDIKKNLLAPLNIAIYAKKAPVIYVNSSAVPAGDTKPSNETDTQKEARLKKLDNLAEEAVLADANNQGSVNKPFGHLQYALNFLANRYNLNTVGAYVRVAANTTYNEQIVLPMYQRSTGQVTIRPYAGTNLDLDNPFYIAVQMPTSQGRQESSGLTCLDYYKMQGFRLVVAPTNVPHKAYNNAYAINVVNGGTLILQNFSVGIDLYQSFTAVSGLTTMGLYGIAVYTGGVCTLQPAQYASVIDHNFLSGSTPTSRVTAYNSVSNGNSSTISGLTTRFRPFYVQGGNLNFYSTITTTEDLDTEQENPDIKLFMRAGGSIYECCTSTSKGQVVVNAATVGRRATVSMYAGHSASGKRYSCQTGGSINSGGAGKTFFPGVTDGTVEDGSDGGVSTYSWYR